MRKIMELIIVLILTIVVTGCTRNTITTTPTRLPVTATPTSTPYPTALPTPTQMVTPRKEIHPTSTIEPTQFHPTPTLPFSSFYNSLSPGQYVVDDNPTFSSLDGKYHETLETGVHSGLVSITRDGKRLVYYYQEIILIDMVENKITRFQATDSCGTPNFSPDNSQIVIACSGELKIISLDNGQSTSVPVWSSLTGWIEFPSWSPNGRWIAFDHASDDPQDPRNGVYIIEIDCLEDPSTCPERTKGPYLGPATNFSVESMLSWSPDSLHIAVQNSYEDTIHIIDLQNDTVRTLVSHDEIGDLFGIAWSPDGEWLAFAHIFEINLISPWGGEPVLLQKEGGFVIGWISIPWPFAAGDSYVITAAGANLNLRKTPSTSSAVLEKLQPDETITILEGPMKADGYTWWRMRASDGMEGWAVDIPEWYRPVNPHQTTATPTP